MIQANTQERRQRKVDRRSSLRGQDLLNIRQYKHKQVPAAPSGGIGGAFVLRS